MLRVITFSFERWKNYAFNWFAKKATTATTTRAGDTSGAKTTWKTLSSRKTMRTSNEIVARFLPLSHHIATPFPSSHSSTFWNETATQIYYAEAMKKANWQTGATLTNPAIPSQTAHSTHDWRFCLLVWILIFQRKKNTINFTRFTTNVRIKRRKIYFYTNKMRSEKKVSSEHIRKVLCFS